MTPALTIAGITPMTTTDFPGRLAAVVFLQGCPWRCGYCHNPHLWPRESETAQGWDALRAFLVRRQGLLDGIVYSGGEPLLQGTLPEALRETRALGFETGLHTGGGYPARLVELLPLLDWVGFDVKAPFEDYERITQVPGSGARAEESLTALLASGVAYECRTTVHPALLDRAALLRMADELHARGVTHWILQEFRSQGCLDTQLVRQVVPGVLDEGLCAQLGARFEHFSVRRA